MLLAFFDALQSAVWVNDSLMLLLDMSLKASVLLLIAAAVLRLTRRRSPGLGFSAVSAALVGALLLPILALLMPRFNVPLLPRPIASVDSAVADARSVDSFAGNVEREKNVLLRQQTATMLVADAPSISRSQHTIIDTTNQDTYAVSAELGDSHGELATAATTGSLALTNRNSFTLGPVIFYGWMAGALAMTVWLLLGLLRLRSWSARGRALASSELGYDAQWLAKRIGVRGTMRLVESPDVASPMTFGWQSPVVLLPSTWRTWSRDQMRIVLLHEFMHVRRGDWAYLLMARLATALHWYNPLVWMAARWLEDQRELACDDDVVRCGARPTDYATTLLQMASRMVESRWGMALSVNMAARPRLEQRVVSILTASKRRRAVATLPIVIALSGVVGMLSVIEPWHDEAAEARGWNVADTQRSANGGRGRLMSGRELPKAEATGFDISRAIRSWQQRNRDTQVAPSQTEVTAQQIDDAPAQAQSVEELIPRIGDMASQTSAHASSYMIERDDERVLRWQQALANFDDAEHALRAAVIDGDFSEAQRRAADAYEYIAGAREFAPTITAYESYRHRAVELATYVNDEAARRTDAMLAEIRAQIEFQARTEAAEQAQQLRAQARRLLNHAVELGRLNQIEDALVLLDRVTQLLPEFEEAHDLRDTLTAVYERRQDRYRQQAMNDATRSVLIENTVARHAMGSERALYPSDWPERGANRSDPSRSYHQDDDAVRRKLNTVVPEIEFDGRTVEEALTTVRAAANVNLDVDWEALEIVGIDRNDEVSLRLTAVSCDKVLAQLLQQIGGDAQLGYRIDRGVIEVSTIEALSRHTQVKAYDLGDLVTTIPSFRGARVDRTQVGQSNGQRGGLAGGRFLEGGGSSNGSGSGIIVDDNSSEHENENEDEDTASLIELIRATIEPESWRSAGGNVGGITAVNHQLVVTQTSSAHGQLEDL